MSAYISSSGPKNSTSSSKTYEEIVTQTLLNQLGIAGKNSLLSFNNEKVEANFSKLYCVSTYLTKKCVKPILIHPQKSIVCGTCGSSQYFTFSRCST